MGCEKDRIKYGLIGKRLSYSYSQRIHEKLMEQNPCLRDGVYHLLEMPNLRFPSGYRGFNITNPYKNRGLVEERLRDAGYTAGENSIRKGEFFCGLFDDETQAERCYRDILDNAVNTVLIEDGKYSLHNTDIFGFCYSFGNRISHLDEAWILGTGATSKMVQILMHHLQISCTAVGREGLHPHFAQNRLDSNRHSHSDRNADSHPNRSIDPVSVSERTNLQSHLSRRDIRHNGAEGCRRMLVNCTPIGTSGNPDSISDMGINQETLRFFDFVVDLTYNPEVTPLVDMAARLGIEAKSGLEMLVAQAVMAQVIWNSDVLTK